jgi:hypothetical protein
MAAIKTTLCEVSDRSKDLSPALRRRIDELSELQADWDGEGAATVKPRVLADVIEALQHLSRSSSQFREPFLAPTFAGFVQMEWQAQSRALELEATNQGWSIVGTEIARDGRRQYHSALCHRSGLGQLEKFYDWYLGNELLWPSP